MDEVMGTNYADDYLDLVALGMDADMMSLLSFETKHLINKGLKQIKNPFFAAMVDKNRYSIGDNPTPMGVAFYVAPFVNAAVRSGTQEEKEIIFKSMLKHKAFEKILSNKRGHKPGEMEQLYIQATRTATNVKNRQTRTQDAGLAFLENMIE
jgi:single-stranded-DNA-specific exonuclease